MINDIIDKVPKALKSLWAAENELRSAAQNGMFLRKEEAAVHLAEARKHLEEMMAATGEASAAGSAQSSPPAANLPSASSSDPAE